GVELARPTEKTLQMVGDWLRSRDMEAQNFIDAIDKEEFDADDIKRAFDNAVAVSESLRETGWKVEVRDTEKAAITVYPIERIIVIPRSRRASKAKVKE